jgi:hypothetical protein
MRDFIASCVAYAIVAALFPVLVVFWFWWRDHERRVLCDGGEPGA